MSATFYATLPARARFADLADPGAYAPLPDEWTVVITDVKGSTQAVKDGRYRDVNYVGAAGIAAALGAVPETGVAAERAEIPFVFGGDGATLAVPPTLLGDVLGALAALQRHADERLGLPLRVGAVPMAEIREAGHEIAVAKVRVSENYDQALFMGAGMAWAEDRVKDPETASRYASQASPTSGADPYAGLECRWQDIRSPHGETVALLVAAVGEAATETYRDVLAEVEAVYGEDAHPIALPALRLSTDPRRLSPEVGLRHGGRLGARAKLWALGLVGRVLLRRQSVTSETDWGAYPRLLRASTDYRKFDGVLRMVLAGTPEQRERLVAFLDDRFARGELAWGLHVSNRAVMTCLVYHRMGQQVHFVDGAEGGYTAAAEGFKRRLKSLAGHADRPADRPPDR
ncbi:MAG: DUF3095 domain-containing protein [Bacteroidota bacterium]